MLDKLYFGLINLLTRGHYAARPARLELTPLEERLMLEVVKALPQTAGTMLEHQIANFNLIQRDGNSQKSVFYRLERGTEQYPEELLFPRREPNLVFANVSFRVAGVRDPFHAAFWAHNGRLFQIAFDRSVREVSGNSEVEIVGVRVSPEKLVGSGDV